MIIRSITFASLVLLLFANCSSDNVEPTVPPTSSYFPPNNSSAWETLDPADLGWDISKIPELLSLLEGGKSRAFIVLKDGKIVMEHYWGKDLLDLTDFDRDKQWYWASAAKTLKAFTVGKAAEEGFLSLTDKTSDYLGNNWTSLTSEQEDKITIWNQLTMTSGLEPLVFSAPILAPENLQFKATAGERWAYHNPPYTLLTSVVEQATASDYDTYFNAKLRDPIGMDGNWLWSNEKHLYFSTGRSMARYGYLMLQQGKWEGAQLINTDFVKEMMSTSQDINKSYGYLWWLNGKASYMIPGLQFVFNGSIIPQAPNDMYAGIGKDGQYVCVVPSKNIVVIRMGENPNNAVVPIGFLDEIWEQLSEIIKD